MTDVPFLLLCLFSLNAFADYHFQNKTVSFYYAVMWAIGAFFVRQPGILLLVAYGFILLIQHRKNWLRTLLILILGIGSFLLMEKCIKPHLGISEHSVPASTQLLSMLKDQPIHSCIEIFKQSIKTFIYLGFYLIPLIPVYWRASKGAGLFRLNKILIVSVGNSIILLAFHLGGKIFPFGGNILFNLGLGPELLADVYTFSLNNTPSLPIWVMYLLQWLAQCNITLFLLLLWHYRRQRNPKLRYWFLMLVALNLSYLGIMSTPFFFDRYILLPMLSMFLFIAWAIPSNNLNLNFKKAWLLVLFGLFSLMATHDYLSWNRARHKAFSYLMEQRIGIQHCDAGYEYNGWLNYHPGSKRSEGKSPWWVTDDTYCITFGPMQGYMEQKAFPYRRWLFNTTDSIWILKKIQPE